MAAYRVAVSTGDFDHSAKYLAESTEHAAFVAGMFFLAYHLDITTPGNIIKMIAPDFFNVVTPRMVELAEDNYTVTVEEL